MSEIEEVMKAMNASQHTTSRHEQKRRAETERQNSISLMNRLAKLISQCSAGTDMKAAPFAAFIN